MYRFKVLLAILLASCLGLSQAVHAVSWSPLEEEQEATPAKGMVKGAVVCLFQSGTTEVRKTISANDILHVYRENKSRKSREVGKIKVLSFVGEDYIKAEVVEGEIRSGDVAKKGAVASLVISPGDGCSEQ